MANCRAATFTFLTKCYFSATSQEWEPDVARSPNLSREAESYPPTLFLNVKTFDFEDIHLIQK